MLLVVVLAVTCLPYLVRLKALPSTELQHLPCAPSTDIPLPRLWILRAGSSLFFTSLAGEFVWKFTMLLRITLVQCLIFLASQFVTASPSPSIPGLAARQSAPVFIPAPLPSPTSITFNSTIQT